MFLKLLAWPFAHNDVRHLTWLRPSFLFYCEGNIRSSVWMCLGHAWFMFYKYFWIWSDHLNSKSLESLNGSYCKSSTQGFPGGVVVKNLPANARKEHRFEPWSGKIPHAVEELSPCTKTTEPALYSPCATTIEACMPTAHAPQQEKPLQWEACARQPRVASTCHN